VCPDSGFGAAPSSVTRCLIEQIGRRAAHGNCCFERPSAGSFNLQMGFRSMRLAPVLALVTHHRRAGDVYYSDGLHGP